MLENISAKRTLFSQLDSSILRPDFAYSTLESLGLKKRLFEYKSYRQTLLEE
jgi:hypothetical protein